MNQIFPHFVHFLEKKSSLQPGNKVLIAVSGGSDSMVLLQLFHRALSSFPLHLEVAHVNYGLRGKNSEKDAALVCAECEKKQIPCHIFSWEKTEEGNQHEAMRQFRYEKFWQLFKEENAAVLVTAHHQGDQVESVLMHLLRGSGLKGLSGMRERDVRQEGILLRPLLSVSKTEILEYAKSEKVVYREDKSNESTDYQRNWLRHEILTRLPERYPAYAEALLRFSLHALADDEALQHYTTLESKRVFLEQNDMQMSFVLSSLRTLPQAIRTRLYMKAFSELAGAALCDDHIAHIDQLVMEQNGETKKYALPKEVQCIRFGRMLVLTKVKLTSPQLV